VLIEGVEAGAGDHAANKYYLDHNNIINNKHNNNNHNNNHSTHNNDTNKYDLESRAQEVLDDIGTRGVGRLEGSRSTGLGIDAQLLCLVGVHRSRRRQGSHVENMDAALSYFLSGPLSKALSLVPLYRTCTRPLTFENTCRKSERGAFALSVSFAPAIALECTARQDRGC
jgi:hypothetical protein